MDEVNIKRVVTTSDLIADRTADMLRQAMRLYGYGFGYVVHVGEAGNWALLADEPVRLGEVAVDMAIDYYTGTSVVDCFIAEDGKPIRCLE